MKARFLSMAIPFLCMAILFTACEKSSIPSDTKITDHRLEGADLGKIEESDLKEIEEDTIEKLNSVNSVDKNEPVNIVISPPEGWEAVENSILSVHYGKDTASFMIKEEGFKGEGIKEVVQKSKDAFNSSFDNVIYLDESEIEIDGKEAVKITFTCEVGSLTMKFKYVYLFVDNQTYAITFGDVADTFDVLDADYEKILKDICFE